MKQLGTPQRLQRFAVLDRCAARPAGTTAPRDEDMLYIYSGIIYRTDITGRQAQTAVRGSASGRGAGESRRSRAVRL